MSSMQRDVGRYKDVVRGKVRANLSKFIKSSEMIGKAGKDVVSIPVPHIDTPDFRHDAHQTDGVGQGKGKVGMSLGPARKGRAGKGGAGNAPGEHILEVEFTIDELADMLGEELKLPRIQPKGMNEIESGKFAYRGARVVGPESLRMRKRTFVNALKRQIASGTYDPLRPLIVPYKEDKRFRSPKPVVIRRNSAVVFFIMDLSGSMTEELKTTVRLECFWIDAWLKRNYKGVVNRYIVHDVKAHAVDRDTFYRTRESGGTKFSPAYELARSIILKEHNPADWNIYVFHFSDGQNWSDDNEDAVLLMKEFYLPCVNLFGFGHICPDGGGFPSYLVLLEMVMGGSENLVISQVQGRDSIVRSMRDFFQGGH